MSAETKHHYRAVYKSDHLGVADLEDMMEQGKELTFVIKEVKQEFNKSVAGKKGDHNIAYFTDPSVKPWVLNAGNAKIIKGFAGGNAFVEDWKNIPIRLYVDYGVKMKGETVGGVRIDPVQPKSAPQQKKPFTKEQFDKAKKAGATIEKIQELYTITPEIEAEYKSYVAAEN